MLEPRFVEPEFNRRLYGYFSICFWTFNKLVFSLTLSYISEHFTFLLLLLFFFHTYKKGSIFLKYQLIRKNTSHKIRILSFDSSKMMTLIVNYRSELRQHLYNLGKRFKNKKMFFLFSLFLPFHHTFPFFLFFLFFCSFILVSPFLLSISQRCIEIREEETSISQRGFLVVLCINSKNSFYPNESMVLYLSLSLGDC